MLVDTHCHIFSEYYDNIDEIVERAYDKGIKMIIVNGVDTKSNMEILKLVSKYDIVYGALGIQPEEVSKSNNDDLAFIERHINDEKIIAIGEIGLDYHYECDKELQKKFFIMQLEIAQKYNKPVIIHSRDCINETYNILKSYNLRGIMHCYSGSVDMAKLFNNIGFLLGIGGILTFKNAVKIKEVVDNIDLKYLVVETDCPYLSPEPYRGKKNEPKNVVEVVKKISEIKGIEYNYVCDVLKDNVLSLFDNNLNL